jgi:hypothetical protein
VTQPPQVPSERSKRISDSLLQVPGIVEVRVWEMGSSRVEVGVRVSPGRGAHEALRRAQEATTPLRQPGETWHFGLLSEG